MTVIAHSDNARHLDGASPTPWTPPAHGPGDRSRMERLARLAPGRLAEMFAEADAPESLESLEGDPVCLGLVRGGPVVRRWTASRWNPWLGKSFENIGPNQMRGHNRLRFFGGSRGLTFTAAIGPSLYDGRPALIIRYTDSDTPNPWWVRSIQDELREVEPGLLAGPATLRLRNGRSLNLAWFAVDAAAARPLH